MDQFRQEDFPQLFFLERGLRQALIGAEGDIGTDGSGIIVGKFLVEGNHAALLELAVQNDLKPMIVIEHAGIAQIGEDAAADGDVAVATRTKALEEGFAFVDCGSGRCGFRWFQLGRGKLRKRRKAGFAV